MTATTSDFPSHWPLQRLGEILAFANGVNADKSSYGKGCRFINVLETITYSHIRGPEVPGRVTLPSAVVDAYTVEKGDIVFNRTSETDADVGLASAYIGEERVVFGGFVIRGRPVKNAFDPTYAGYALRAPFIRSQVISMGQGAVRSNIGQESLKRVVVPVPPAKEQRAIAKALSDVDALLARLDRLIAKKRDLKQAAMQQLLTGRRRLPGFDTEWVNRTLKDVGRCLRGVTYRADIDLFAHDRTNTKRLLRSNNVQDATVQTTEVQFVSSERVATDQVLRRNDILICMANGSRALVGKAALFQVSDGYEYTFGSFMGCFRTHFSEANPAYLFYLFQTERYRDYINNLLAGSAINNLLPRSIESLEFLMPAVQEQAAIACMLSDIDDQIAVLQARRGKTATVKQAMMQELLTGRIRLI